MRYPGEHKEQVRARILDAAASFLRKEGLERLSIPAVMKRVGLTHGGFYNHFRDRDELVAEAVRRAASESPVVDPERDLSSLAAAYLSEGHRAHPEMGCVVAAVGTDAMRQPASTRHVLGEIARGFVRHVAAKVDGGSADDEKRKKPPSDRALVAAAGLVGAIVLARMVDDPELSSRVLAAARRSLGAT